MNHTAPMLTKNIGQSIVTLTARNRVLGEVLCATFGPQSRHHGSHGPWEAGQTWKSPLPESSQQGSSAGSCVLRIPTKGHISGDFEVFTGRPVGLCFPTPRGTVVTFQGSQHKPGWQSFRIALELGGIWTFTHPAQSKSNQLQECLQYCVEVHKKMPAKMHFERMGNTQKVLAKAQCSSGLVVKWGGGVDNFVVRLRRLTLDGLLCLGSATTTA